MSMISQFCLGLACLRESKLVKSNNDRSTKP